MLKKILIMHALIISACTYTMQPGQAAGPQGQAQKPKPKPKPKPAAPTNDQPATDQDTQNPTPAPAQEPVALPVTPEPASDNASQTDAQTNTDAQTQTDTETKKHIRICPTCGGIADQCPEDLYRRNLGILLPCACDDCC